MSFCRPWWLPTSHRHTDCIYQSCSGIPWPFSALPTWSRSWCLSLSATRCASTEPCSSGTSCPEKTAGGNWIVAWKFVQSGRCIPLVFSSSYGGFVDTITVESEKCWAKNLSTSEFKSEKNRTRCKINGFCRTEVVLLAIFLCCFF